MHRHSAEGCLGNEPECPFGTDHQMFQDLDRLVEINERVHPVTHGVLDGISPGDVGPHLGTPELIAQAFQHRHQFGLGAAQFVIGVAAGRVDDRAAGQHEHH